MPARPFLAALFLLVGTVSAALLLGSPPVGASAAWTWPVHGDVLTAYRNGDDPYAGGQHRGIDVAAEPGAPVAAAVGGTVRFAGVAGSSGLTVSVRTADGRYDTSYLHLADVTVREGEQVAAGQRLGSVGTSGRRSVGQPHLHFGVRDAGSRHAYHDPLSFLPPLAPSPAPEPRGAPVPAPVPVVPAPAPAPLPVRLPERRRVRVPASRRLPVPAGRRVRIPTADRPPTVAPAPAPVPVGSPAAAPAASQRAGEPVRSPSAKPHEAAARAGDTAPIGPVPSPNTLRRPGELANPSPGHRTPATAREGGGGPDLGWALACVGLLLAAALLGRPGDTHHGPGGAAMRLRSLLRPLTGGR